MNEIGPFLTLIVIGAAVGIAMTRYGRNWIGRQVANVTGAGASDVTYVLVGIAGSFIGFHVGLLVGAGQIVLYVLALVGAALTIWLWRGR
jgi:hypothetical protein